MSTSLASQLDWFPCVDLLPPDGKVVETKIDDENGVRNVQPLQRRGNLWWTHDGVMYVYYRPTHWREVQS